MVIQTLFEKAAQAGASDVHLTVGSPVMFRIDGTLQPQTKAVLKNAEVEQCAKAVLGSRFKRLESEREIDVSYALGGGVRLRVNVHFERENVGLVARIIPSDIPSLEQVGLSELGPQLARWSEGLILFTGPTGSGKSTSMASLITHIATQRPVSVVTMEDPIEFELPAGKGIMRQRQFGTDFLSFAEALKRVLRQDPNIVMVGEMRDPETVAAALTLAETGHLIIATLHTPNAVQTVNRIIDVFPAHQQPQIRSQLSLSLRAVVAQRLVPSEKGGRVAAREVLVNTPAASNVIRDNRLQELRSVLQTGSDIGMRTFEKDARRLYKEGLISKETYGILAS
jgi:twitching motility protein PilT